MEGVGEELGTEKEKKRQGEGKETKGRNAGDIFECGLLFEFLKCVCNLLTK